jgi:hypothetical protein
MRMAVAEENRLLDTVNHNYREIAKVNYGGGPLHLYQFCMSRKHIADRLHPAVPVYFDQSIFYYDNNTAASLSSFSSPPSSANSWSKPHSLPCSRPCSSVSSLSLPSHPPSFLEHLLMTSTWEVGRQTLWHLPTVSVSLTLGRVRGEARKKRPIEYVRRFLYRDINRKQRLPLRLVHVNDQFSILQ